MTIRDRRKKLEEMARGNGLSDVYAETLTRLKAQKGNRSELGLKALMWVLYSKRPLRAEELCHALGVKIGSADRDPENVPAIRTVLSSCLGLLTVEASSSIVRLVHFTLQEHLSSDLALFDSPHSTIAEVCLTYLNFGSVRQLSPTLRWAPATMPLLEYASLYWGEHSKMGMTENVKMLALRLLDRFDEHISAELLLLHHYYFNSYFCNGGRGPWGFTGLHGVAFLGIVEIVVPVLGMKKWDINAADCTGNTALIWAARRGQEDVVKVLLEREDLNPDQIDTKYGRTPLSWAAGEGHQGVVQILLQRKGVNPDQRLTMDNQRRSWGETFFGTAGYPSMPGSLSMLGSPQIPGNFSMMGNPQLPVGYSMPGNPQPPGNPTMPWSPQLPVSLSMPGNPQLPVDYSMQGSPHIPGNFSMLGNPQLPGKPSMQGNPQIPVDFSMLEYF